MISFQFYLLPTSNSVISFPIVLLGVSLVRSFLVPLRHVLSNDWMTRFPSFLVKIMLGFAIGWGSTFGAEAKCRSAHENKDLT